MNWVQSNLLPAQPEITLLIALCAILIIDLFVCDEKKIITYILSLLALVIVAGVQFYTPPKTVTLAFNGMFIVDNLSQTIKYALYASVFVGFVYSKNYLIDRKMFKGEFFTLSLFALMGMNIMVSAGNFIVLFIGLELLSLSLYTMIAMEKTKQSIEAALKYFVLGSMASGLLLFGMSMVYGAAHSLDISIIFDSLVSSDISTGSLLLARFGLVFIVAGLVFKLGLVPFHMWVPDVYQGTPTPIVLFVGAAPKLAVFAMIIRILVDGLGFLIKDWYSMLIVLAVLSILLGNLIAIAQTNVKRMLAYSTISHMGFVMLAFACSYNGETVEGSALSSSLFYVVSYILMSLVGFGVLISLSSKDFECSTLEDLKGLSQSRPWLAFLMLLTMFSMAGIPPMLGFFAKLNVIEQLISRDYVALAVFAVLMSLIGTFYYLRVVKVMYFDKVEHTRDCRMSSEAKVLLSLNALLLLFCGFYSNELIHWCAYAFTLVTP